MDGCPNCWDCAACGFGVKNEREAIVAALRERAKGSSSDGYNYPEVYEELIRAAELIEKGELP